jgi:pimeloyl-ACP methyl ester carboxylesterase
MRSDQKSVTLPQGPIHYADAGEGEPIVFVHGYLVDSRLWDGVARELGDGFRCIQADWPMGSHREAMRPDADLSPPGMAKLIDGFLAELGLENVTIVGNDSGGAMSQVLITERPERVGRLVLTNCDCYDNFPPAPFGTLLKLARVPGFYRASLAPLRLRRIRNLLFSPFAQEVPEELAEAWSRPSLDDGGVRRDGQRFAMAMDKRYTLEAAERFAKVEQPALITWGTADRIFPKRYGERLANELPNARLVEIEGGKTFLPLDEPQAVAEAIAAFMRETADAPAAA